MYLIIFMFYFVVKRTSGDATLLIMYLDYPQRGVTTNELKSMMIMLMI